MSNRTDGKFEKDALDDMVMMEYSHFFSLLSTYMPPGPLRENAEFKSWLVRDGKDLARRLSDYMILALPRPRQTWYKNNNYAEVQRLVTGYTNQIVHDLGFFSIRLDLDLLGDLELFSQATMFLGLIFDVVTFLFVVLSVLLIYSLLMISVEGKSFEFGVLRMAGLSQSGIVTLVLTQAFLFVIPSVIVGFGLAISNLRGLNATLFPGDEDASAFPDGYAVVQALAMGILIPLLSSIVPIQTAFSKDLNESLDIQRSKSKAVMVEILDPKKSDLTAYVTFGTVAVAFGMSIYYFLPLALLSFNLSLVLQIFMFILVGMLTGLSMLAFNLQRLAEIGLTHTLLFFVDSSMKAMVTSNLAAHRARNKMTSIIYSIALGFIIFLIVSARLQMRTIRLQSVQYEGAYLILKTDTPELLKPPQFDAVLRQHSGIIREYAYITAQATNGGANFRRTQVADKARISRAEVSVYASQPHVFETLLELYTQNYWRSGSALSYGEQLYTARGS